MEHYVNEAVESGDIGFDNVSFSYDDTPILDCVTITIPKNKTTAIVGFSGSGKSTLLKLLERVYELTDGRVLLGGKNFYDYSLTEWRDKIAVVSQNSPMISGTIRDNILFGIMREISDEEIMEAAKSAYIYDFISKCSEGLDYQVGQFGVKLSGGQRQKISIARAILKNPEYLLLDEPTASLDILSMNKIVSTIESLKGKMTIVVAAHQPRIAQTADNIIVVNSNHTAIEGTHNELIQNNEFYKKLINNELEVVLDEYE